MASTVPGYPGIFAGLASSVIDSGTECEGYGSICSPPEVTARGALFFSWHARRCHNFSSARVYQLCVQMTV